MLHETFVALTVGILFLQSPVVVMAPRGKDSARCEATRETQRHAHRVAYYPLLVGGLLSGLAPAWQTGAFGEGRWLHWKLVPVALLIGLGLLLGRLLRRSARGAGRARGDRARRHRDRVPRGRAFPVAPLPS